MNEARAGKLRIQFLTQDGSGYVLPLFEEFLRNYSGEFDIINICYSPPMGSRPRVQLALELLCLYGPIGFARLAARFLRGRALGFLRLGRNAKKYYTLPQLAAAYHVPCQRIENPNQPEIVRQITERGPELIVSVACPYILKRKLLSIPALGCINIHHAPLPRYQGMMPTFWQMYHGETKVGLTIHEMRERVDDGPLLLQEDLEIRPDESLDELIVRSKSHAAQALARVLRDIQANRVETWVPAGPTATYFTFPTLGEIREFRRRGLRAL